MAIAALPSNTVHAIGSSQVLSDSASVVKELIDNALDGRATAIFVEISTNALDIIQIKDNGHGIAPGDRGMLCRWYCTSKIRDFADLTNIGGQSLGFRGEALASAAEMSGSLTISTRVEGEPTATSIKFKRQGGIESEEKTSYPVGTTVRVVDYLKSIPVRRQTALKSPTKLLSKIKKMVQTYALARPSIRFSLKVLKAKTDKGNWMYAPKSGATPEAVLTDAVIQVVGKKVVEQSKWTVWSSSTDEQTAIARVETAGNDAYTVEAVLPVPACDTSLFNNIGQFVSIDSRPVSCARGTLKHMIGLYKSYLRSASSSTSGQNLVDPFLYMNIICPQGSYDINVEPAKDDALFTNNDLLLKVIQDFLTNVYGELRAKENEDVRPNPPKPRSQGFELLLARKPPSEVAANQMQYLEGNDKSGHVKDMSSTTNGMKFNADSVPITVSYAKTHRPDASFTSPQSTVRDPNSQQTSPVSESLLEDTDGLANNSTVAVDGRAWKRNMYANDDFDVDNPHSGFDEHNKWSLEPELDGQDAICDINVSNPWAFAKINAPIRPLRKNREAEAVFDANGQLFTPVRQRGEARDDLGLPNGHDRFGVPLRRPRRDLPTPDSSRIGVSSALGLQSSSPEPFPYPLKAWGKGEGGRAAVKPPVSERERYGNGALDTWVQKSLDSHSSSPGRDDISLLDSDPSTANHPREFVSARSLPIGTPLSDIPAAAPRSTRKPGPRKHQQSGVNEPFVSPLDDTERVWFDLEPKRRTKPARLARSENDRDAIVAITPIRHDREVDSTAEFPSSAASLEPMHPDLASIMDYELRKQAALDHRKIYLRQQAAAAIAAKLPNKNSTGSSLPSQAPQTSPHNNRYHKAIAALHPAQDPPLLEHTPIFEPSDPRAYLIRAQQREYAERLTNPAVKRRRKTEMLPLEVVREESTARNLTLKLEVALRDLKKSVSQAAVSDAYVRSGDIEEAFAAAEAERVRAWEGKLRDLNRMAFGEESENAEVRIDLSTALQAHLAAHASA